MMPGTIIDRATIDASGEVSVADYLRTTNFNSVGQFRPQSGSSAQAGAFADLRGLGGQRTLVLIDGHRAPKAPFAAGAGTDLNANPLAAVERIEVLTDGASAVYGRSEEHTSELQSLMRISYAVFCLKKKTTKTHQP